MTGPPHGGSGHFIEHYGQLRAASRNPHAVDHVICLSKGATTRRRVIIMMKKQTVSAMLALSLATAGAASPALAKHRAARAGFDANAQAIGGELAARASQRAAALRQCNAEAAPLLDYTWGEAQSDRYRACMAEHGQME
jgi:hypothetical protein